MARMQHITIEVAKLTPKDPGNLGKLTYDKRTKLHTLTFVNVDDLGQLRALRQYVEEMADYVRKVESLCTYTPESVEHRNRLVKALKGPYYGGSPARRELSAVDKLYDACASLKWTAEHAAANCDEELKRAIPALTRFLEDQ